MNGNPFSALNPDGSGVNIFHVGSLKSPIRSEEKAKLFAWGILDYMLCSQNDEVSMPLYCGTRSDSLLRDARFRPGDYSYGMPGERFL